MQLDLKTLGLDHLTRSERLQLIDLLWDSVGDQVESEDIPEWHLRELDRRLADDEANPGQGRPWEEVLADLRKKV